MKFLLFILTMTTITLINANTDFSRNYQLLALENSNFRDFSLEELTFSIGDDAKLLNYYKCNDVNEFNVFFKLPRYNSSEDSLKIKSSISNDVFTYKKGKVYNQLKKRVHLFKNDPFVENAIVSLKKIEKTKNGSTLLRLIEKSHYPLTITKGRNSFSSHLPERNYAGIYMSQAIMIFLRLRKADDSVPFRAIGNGGHINWNPNANVESLEVDGVTRITAPEITLSHELYHAFDSIRGLLDFRLLRSFSSSEKNNENYILDEYDFNKDLNAELASTCSTEKRLESNTTNLGEYRAVYFENLMRKELKYKYRKSYHTSGEDEVAFLDNKNEPINFSAPCLL